MRQQYFKDTRTGEIVTQIKLTEISHFIKWTGPVETGHPCDERCTSARGNLCECSCAGVNHGRDWDSGQDSLFNLEESQL